MEMDPPPKMLASLTITILMMMMATSVALASSDAAVLEGQARALLDWKASLDNQSQRALHSWGNTSTPCNWRGITCGTGRQSQYCGAQGSSGPVTLATWET
ncbi:probable inactive leucine-rich repeat receptor-like protein kinase At1g66830 [Triticum aestivum]|uniref:probable inactive leucine-rich repeat receptor-like protein kinase At1g66830 n=1 Tax=Triticum aestivum TaxID=4565 RepID=UPI001D00655C|nr:probable inactive leucine-rich repeat receptor-like protein kinase At1g66830 [Triticum aestivum]